MVLKGFRYDINALRAFAVVSVVLYHFQVPLFFSGFVGVDVFFVISGFLMTKIIYISVQEKTFDFISFFFSRVKRIMPALFFMCSVLLVLGWFYLLPIDYRQLSKHVISSVLFISNIILSGESGYFDVSSAKKYLLHTWSLSIEWQFYVLLPFLLVGLLKLKNITIAPIVIALLAALSLSYSLFFSNSQDIYFSFSARAWEMLIGSLVYFIPPPKSRKKIFHRIVSIVLLSCLIFSTLVIDSQDRWPSLWTLIPVFCTAALIWLSSDFKFYQWRPISFLGEISYSFYLWHWPVVVYLISRYHVLSYEVIIQGIIVSLFFAWLSYKYIEIPTRTKEKTIKVIKGGMASVGLLCILALSVFVTNGLPFKQRLPEIVYMADLEFLNREPRKDNCLTLNGIDSSHCIYGDSQDVSLIIFGDSHASAIVSAVEKILPFGESILFIAKAGCPSLLMGDIRKPNGGECKIFVEKQISIITKNYPETPIMVVSRWPYYYFGSQFEDVLMDNTDLMDSSVDFKVALKQTWCDLAVQRDVYFLTPTPEFKSSVPNSVARALWNRSDLPSLNYDEYLNRNDFILSVIDDVAAICNISVIDVAGLLCIDDECFSNINGVPIYYDDNHLSEFGNKILSPLFVKLFSKN